MRSFFPYGCSCNFVRSKKVPQLQYKLSILYYYAFMENLNAYARKYSMHIIYKYIYNIQSIVLSLSEFMAALDPSS